MKQILLAASFVFLWVTASAQSKSTHYQSVVRGLTATGGILESTHSKATLVNPWTEAVPQQSTNYRHQGLATVVNTTDTSTNRVHLLKSLDVSVYPNPFEHTFHILTEGVISNVKLFDATGKSIPITVSGNRVNTFLIGPGVYVLEVQSDQGIGKARLVKY